MAKWKQYELWVQMAEDKWEIVGQFPNAELPTAMAKARSNRTRLSRWRPGRPTGPSGGSQGRRSADVGCLPGSTGTVSASEREAAPRGTMPVPSPTTRIQPFLLSGYQGEPTRGTVKSLQNADG